jgi:Transposase IS66 family
MSLSLPDIDPEKITTLAEAREAILLLMNSFDSLIHQYVKLEEENNQLKAEIAMLKGQPKRPHYAQKKKENTSESVQKLLKGKGIWHKTSKQGKVAIDREETLDEIITCVCGGTDFKTLRRTKRVVQGLEIKRDNVLYRGRKKQCITCGRIYKSHEPEEIQGTAFTSTLKTLISYLKFFTRTTEPLLYRMINGFGLSISTGQINAIALQNSTKLKPAYHALQTTGITKSSYVQTDATGAKRKIRNGKIKNQYAQIVSNKMLSVFTITQKYTAQTVNQVLGRAGRKKPLVSDDGSQNGDGCRCRIKQLCWVHEIRHYQKLFSFFTSEKYWQKKILHQWRKFYHIAKHYAEAPPEERKKQKEQIEQLFEQITNQKTGYNLLDKQLGITRKKRQRLLIFLGHPYLPIHNNQCELDLRSFVIIRKISGGTKSKAGDISIARHLSIILTAQKQGLDVYQTLHGLLIGKLSPSILTANIS